MDLAAQADGSPADAVVELAVGGVVADWGARPAAWAAAAGDAVGAEAAAGASNNHDVHTKGGRHSSAPNSRPD